MKNYKAALPHAIAVLIFFLLASVYFTPHFSGYSLNQHDMQTAAGMSKETNDFRETEKTEPLWTNAAFGGMPTYQISVQNNSNWLPKVESFIFTKLFSYSIGYLVIAMISFYILMLCFGISPWLGVIGAIAFGFSTINILYLEAGHVTKVHAIALIPGIIGSMIYAYRKNMRIGAVLLGIFVCLHVSANHIQETYYLLFLILAILLVEFYRFYKEKILASFLKISLFLAVAVVLGALPTMSNILLTNEYSKATTRGKSELTVQPNGGEKKASDGGLEDWYIKQYSLGYGEAWSLAVPNIKGGESAYIGSQEDKMQNVSAEFKQYVANFPSYWGEQSFSGGAFYFGAIIFLLFVLGMVFIRDRLKWAFFAISMLAIMLSWKYSSLVDIFINNVPMFSKFRDTKMMLVLAQVAFPLLGILFVKELFTNKLDNKKLNYTLAGSLGVFVLFYMMPTFWFNFFSTEELNYFSKQVAAYAGNSGALQQFEQFKSEIQDVRILIFKADVLRTIFFMALAGALVMFYNRGKIAQKYFIIALGLLVLIDIWSVDKRYLNNKKENGEYKSWLKNYNQSNPYMAGVADNQILSIEMSSNPELAAKINDVVNKVQANDDISSDNYLRTEQSKAAFSMLNSQTDYRVLTLQDPFSNASVSYYHKSIGGYHGAKLKRYQELIDFRLSKEYQSLIDALKKGNDTLISQTLKYGIPSLNMLNTKYIIYNSNAAPLVNPYALGSVWFVKELKFVETQDAEILALDSINPAQTVVVEQTFKGIVDANITADSAASIRLKSYKPNHLIYESNTSKPQVAVFSEIYYKDGWNAYVDGQNVPYFRANYALRGLSIPAGQHNVEFKFEPTIYSTSKNISYAGSVLLILFVAGTLFYEFKFAKKE